MEIVIVIILSWLFGAVMHAIAGYDTLSFAMLIQVGWIMVQLQFIRKESGK